MKNCKAILQSILLGYIERSTYRDTVLLAANDIPNHIGTALKLGTDYMSFQTLETKSSKSISLLPHDLSKLYTFDVIFGLYSDAFRTRILADFTTNDWGVVMLQWLYEPMASAVHTDHGQAMEASNVRATFFSDSHENVNKHLKAFNLYNNPVVINT